MSVNLTCSRCGCPARMVRALARVTYELEPNGTRGRLMRAQELTQISERRYMCGARHEWPADDVEAEKVEEA